MAPLIDDLKKLERGITLENGEVLKAGVLFYLGDNLESCEVGGFSTHFAHGYVCRICHQQYDDLPAITGIPKAPYWKKDEYDDGVRNDGEKKFGLRTECVFNQLESFHAVGQFPLDAMHDFLIKVGTCDAQAVIVSLAATGKVNVSRYNDILSNLPDLGRDDPLKVNVKRDKLDGKAMSVASHIHVMPFVLSHILKDDEDSDILDLLFLLHKLNEYILADSFSLADVYNFQVIYCVISRDY